MRKCKLCYKFCVTILPFSWGNPSHQLELAQQDVQHSVWKHQHQCQRGDCQWAQHCCPGAYDGPLCSPTPPLLLLSLLIPLQLYGTAKHSNPRNCLRKLHYFDLLLFFCWDGKLNRKSAPENVRWKDQWDNTIPCATDEVDLHHADSQQIPFLPLMCWPSWLQAAQALSHSHLQGQIQDIAPSPQHQCLCLHIASHVTLSCKFHGLKFLLSPVCTQLSVWKAHTTLWEEHNPQSPECSPLCATTFLCQNAEDSIPAFPFYLHPGKWSSTYSSGKNSEERDDNSLRYRHSNIHSRMEGTYNDVLILKSFLFQVLNLAATHKIMQKTSEAYKI